MNSATGFAAMGVVLSALLAACAGVPLTSVPRLIALQGELMNADPAQFMLAIQTDVRMVPAPGAVPTLNIEIRPREAGAFEALERKLPMLLNLASAPAGLPRAGAGRRWMIYSLSPESASELARIQTYFKRLQGQRGGSSGGSLGVGIAQDGVAADDPSFARTEWQSWLQTSAAAGFFELWSGTIGQLKDQARASQAKAAAR
jgi:hypothetical protein